MEDTKLSQLPPEIWGAIADQLELKDVPAFVLVCREFAQLMTDKKITEKWFRELEQQYQGNGAEEVRVLLKFALENKYRPKILLELLNGLLDTHNLPVPEQPNETEIARCVRVLRNKAYREGEQNPKQRFIFALQMVIGKHKYDETPATMLKRDAAMEGKINAVIYALLSIAAICLFFNIYKHFDSRMDWLPFKGIGSASVFISAVVYGFKSTEFWKSRRRLSFWSQVDALPADERAALPALQRMRAQQEIDLFDYKMIVLCGASVIGAGLIFALLFMNYINQPRVESVGQKRLEL